MNHLLTRIYLAVVIPINYCFSKHPDVGPLWGAIGDLRRPDVHRLHKMHEDCSTIIVVSDETIVGYVARGSQNKKWRAMHA